MAVTIPPLLVTVMVVEDAEGAEEVTVTVWPVTYTHEQADEYCAKLEQAGAYFGTPETFDGVVVLGELCGKLAGRERPRQEHPELSAAGAVGHLVANEGKYVPVFIFVVYVAQNAAAEDENRLNARTQLSA